MNKTRFTVLAGMILAAAASRLIPHPPNFTPLAAIALFGGVFLMSLGRGFFAIRRGDVDRHREWMIRAFAMAIGISTIRVVGLVFDLVLTPYGMPVKEGFVLTIWVGWLLTAGMAEMWIRRTRHGLKAVPYTDVLPEYRVGAGL